MAEGKMVDDDLVSKRHIVPSDKIPGPSPDSDFYEALVEQEKGEEE